MQTLNAKQVQALNEKDLALVDVLPVDSYEKQHIPGAVNVPFEDEHFLERVERIVGDKDSKVVVYCASEDCDLSPRAARKLAEAGYQEVADFEGGLKEWQEAGFPLEGEAVRS